MGLSVGGVRVVRDAVCFTYAQQSDYSLVLDQYLRTTKIPVLRYSAVDGAVMMWWEDVLPGFAVPVLVSINGEEHRLTVAEDPVKVAIDGKLQSFQLNTVNQRLF